MSDETQAVEKTSQTEAVNQQPPASSPAVETAPAEAQSTELVQSTTEAQPQVQTDDDGLLTGGDQAKEFDEPAKAEGEQPKAEEEKSIFGAPDEYKFEDAEGVIASGISGFTEAVKGLNLNQETASAILSKSIEGIKADRATERAALRQETLSDPRLNWRNSAVQIQANRAYQTFFGDHPRIQAKLKALNLDVDREFLGIMHRLGGEMSTGSFVQGKQQGTDENDFRRMYPATKMNR